MVKNNMAAGTAQPSFVSNLIEQLSGEKGHLTADDEQLIKSTAGTLYGAGAETVRLADLKTFDECLPSDAQTQNVFTAFVLAMVRYPHVFKKVRQEMDRVVGTERLPDFGDRESLPYLECVIRETYRWHVPTPLGIPHFSMKDDEYKGYVIPANSLMIANIWGIAHDTAQYSDPDEFIPERFENLDKETSDRLDPKNYVFGFGRRLCPARNFADANVFLVLATMVATLDISGAIDEQGREIIPEHAYKAGFVQ
ncbi:hypothetical protein EUX98_g8040 [Antrodiella citrinella]|uniref:Cytochrome P450 n=1 Tax=Antrodiella citrinella TaxID=2447956 RepID=A0A4V3XGX7_9APHY|nr:hypothetical protein EUX98_g8040 [Antrodiella citrinella]